MQSPMQPHIQQPMAPLQHPPAPPGMMRSPWPINMNHPAFLSGGAAQFSAFRRIALGQAGACSGGGAAGGGGVGGVPHTGAIKPGAGLDCPSLGPLALQTNRRGARMDTEEQLKAYHELYKRMPEVVSTDALSNEFSDKELRVVSACPPGGDCGLPSQSVSVGGGREGRGAGGRHTSVLRL